MSLSKRQDRQERNYLINSAKDFAQRSTSVENLTTSYVFEALDRHAHKNTGNFTGTPTVARSVDSPNAKTKYCSDLSGQFDDTSAELSECQPIESVNSRELAGETVSLSVWVKSSSCTTLRLDLSSADVEDVFTAVTSEHSEVKTIVDDGNWQLVEFTNISLSSNVSRGLLKELTFVNAQDTTGATSHKITRAKLNIGSTAQDWSYNGRDYEDELHKCKRYYEKSYLLDVNPGTITTAGAIYGVPSGTGANSLWHNTSVIIKRAISTVVTYNPATGATGSWDRAATPIASQVPMISTQIVRITNSAATNDNNGHSIHYTADAEMAI